MTARSVPIQVLTILPSLPLLLAQPAFDRIDRRKWVWAFAQAAEAYSLPEVSTAQTIRAVLAACASTATFIGRLAKMPRCQGVARSWRDRALRMRVAAPRAKSLRSRLSPCRLTPRVRRL